MILNEKSIFIAGVYEGGSQVAMTIAILLIFALVMVIIISEMITRPIAILTKNVQDFAQGNSTSFHSSRITEVDNLNDSFKKMAKQLSSHREHLEDMVSQRTDELEKSRQTAENANQAKSQFLSNMSHELRTPLNAVLGFSEILKTQTHDSKSIGYLRAISSAGNTLLALINSVLDLAKIESGKMELEYNPTSLKHLLNEVHSFFYQQSAERDILFEIQTSDTLEECLLIDTLKLKQVLINLCSNAIKFTHDGSVRVNVTTTTSHLHGRVDINIEIIDTGKGIPESQQERIFYAFEQIAGQKSSEYGGTGLGLVITLKIVHLMGGTINVVSEGENKGSCFSIKIPDVEICNTLASELTENTTMTFEKINFKPAKLMIIDDISYNRSLMLSYLAEWPFEMIEAENGQDALDKMRDFTPDLILTDLRMPVIDGQTLCIRLREELGSNCMPLIIVTASAMADEQQDLLSICNELLTKPLAKQTLVKCLLKYLQHSISETSSIDKITSENKETKAIDLALLSQDQRNQLIELIEIGDSQNAVKLCMNMSPELTAESKWIVKMLESFELAKLITQLKSADNSLE